MVQHPCYITASFSFGVITKVRMPRKGYAKIAAQMAKHPESAMVRQFGDLNLQNILYLQAELVGLEEDFRRLEAKNDASEDEEKAAFSLDWHALHSYGQDDDDSEGSEQQSHSGSDNLDSGSEQWELALKIRERLKEYSKRVNYSRAEACFANALEDEAVIQYAQISSLSTPKTRDLHNFQDWMSRPRRGNIQLLGRDRRVWEDGRDLVALRSPERAYPFARWIMKAVPAFHTLFSRRPEVSQGPVQVLRLG
ncbi:hypothetical protein SLS55_005147 [Diplodia seriata]|uniref:DUF6594 domain-containing protein n=1 Tax=Diplodia seriata TaxID=420778 RepID=A0ABR3CGM3_9PEZI